MGPKPRLLRSPSKIGELDITPVRSEGVILTFIRALQQDIVVQLRRAMQVRGSESGQIIVSASTDELRLVLPSLNEVLHRPYAVPDDN